MICLILKKEKIDVELITIFQKSYSLTKVFEKWSNIRGDIKTVTQGLGGDKRQF